MRREILIAVYVALLFCSLKSSAQFSNSGSTIKIKLGADILKSEDFKNISGCVTNSEKLEVRRNFIYAASYTSATNDDSFIPPGSGT